jgi:anti-anti-sigma factor
VPVHHDDHSSLRLDTETADGAVIVHVSGDLYAGTYSALRDTIAALVLRGVDDVIVDMAACTFMDSAGLTALLEAPRGGAHLVVRNPSDRIAATLRAVAVGSIIDIERDAPQRAV